MSQAPERQRSQAETETPKRKPRGSAWWAPRLLLSVFVLLSGSILVLVLLVYNEARSDDAGPADAIVVLGAAQFNGVPSTVFRARLDTAASLYRQGAAPTIVVTGGRMEGDQFTEAETGRNYLVSQGVPEDAILLEHLSSNTRESMERVGEILLDRDMTRVLIVSDGFHLFRSRLLAEEQGFSVQTSHAEMSPIRPGSALEFQYVVREAFALAAHYLGLN